jgi:hypothetical protein
MTDEDREAFQKAVDAAKARCDREKRKLCHVRWKDGVLEFTSRRLDGKDEEPQGWELPEPEIKPARVRRGGVQVELPL